MGQLVSDGEYTKEEIDKILTAEQEYFINYVEKYWLTRYFKMAVMKKDDKVPIIVSKPNRDREKNLEPLNILDKDYQLLLISAGKWIEIFNREVSKMPGDYKELITMKYLNRRRDGRTLEDDVIYPQLNLSRSVYYDLRRSALEELGRALYGSLG